MQQRLALNINQVWTFIGPLQSVYSLIIIGLMEKKRKKKKRL